MIGKYPDMTAAWHAACERLIYSTRDGLHRHAGLTAVLYDNFLAADSMAFDFDVGRDLWLTERRFPKLMRDYLDYDEVLPFIERSKAIAAGPSRRGVITQMHCKAAKQKDGKAQHVWGNCILAMTYHGGGRWGPPTMALHSRVSYIAYLGSMDMALVWVIAKAIAEQGGFEVEEMQFRWYIDALQWHGLKCVPYIMSQGHWDEIKDEEEYPGSEYPTINVTRRSILGLEKNLEAGVGTDRETMLYGPARRMNIRYQRVMGDNNPMPELPVARLYDRFKEEFDL